MERCVLVIGGTGYLGAQLVTTLADGGWSAVAVARHTAPKPEPAGSPIHAERRHVELLAMDMAVPGAGARVARALGDRDVSAIVNVATTTQGRPDAILRDNVAVTDETLDLVKRLRPTRPALRFLSVGSISEYAAPRFQSAYSKAKQTVREHVFRSGLCDAHVVFGFVHPDNPRIEADVPRLLNLGVFRRHPLLLTSFRVASITADGVSRRMVALLDYLGRTESVNASERMTVEVRFLECDVTLGELLLLPDGPQPARRATTPLERVTLAFCSCWLRWTAFGDPLRLRVALFCRLAALSGKPGRQRRENHYQALGTIAEAYQLLEKVSTAAVIRFARDVTLLRASPTVWYML